MRGFMLLRLRLLWALTQCSLAWHRKHGNYLSTDILHIRNNVRMSRGGGT
jgi:hypothetical protein